MPVSVHSRNFPCIGIDIDLDTAFLIRECSTKTVGAILGSVLDHFFDLSLWIFVPYVL